jgi:hypothetical protein
MKKLLFTIALLLSATPFASADNSVMECADGITTLNLFHERSYIDKNGDEKISLVKMNNFNHWFQRRVCRLDTALNNQEVMKIRARVVAETTPSKWGAKTIAELFPHRFGGKE